MERREQTTTTPSVKQLINRFENAVHQAAKDDYVDGGSYTAIDRRARAVEDARKELQDSFNQHTTLVEQRDKLVEALKGVAIMLNTELERYEQEPWAQRVRNALATVEQGEGRES